MTPREVLIAAKALIDTPEKWWRGDSEKDSELACSALAITRTARGVDTTAGSTAIGFLAKAIGGRASSVFRLDDIFRWNDAPERTHAEVMDAFDRAIELAADAETVANLNRDLAAVEASQ